MTDAAFNPLAMTSLAESIVQRLMRTSPVPLGGIPRFNGAGMYAIYYTGDFPTYRIVRDRNLDGAWALPIYVGKAVPKGGRQGVEVGVDPNNTALWSRLKEHARSVDAATNLHLADFHARWLITDDIWIALGESALLRDTRPVWNAMVDGFGNHDPGQGRHRGMVPQWDALHPGRAWAARLVQRPDGAAELIAADALQYLVSRHGT
ncbi:MAG: Eco29kI family restriction endonuclease [Propionicimonas sp.]